MLNRNRPFKHEPENTCQVKAKVADVVFDDNGKPTPVVEHLANLEGDAFDEIWKSLVLDHGLESNAADEILDSFNEILECRIEHEAKGLATRKFRELALLLVGTPFHRTPSGRAFCRVLAGDENRSLEADASECRCTAPAIFSHVKSIREKLSQLIK